jgi:SAM-dependent methyltransferase
VICFSLLSFVPGRAIVSYMNLATTWQSQKVADLLADYYKVNFDYVGSNGSLIREIILEMFKGKDLLSLNAITAGIEYGLKSYKVKKDNLIREKDILEELDLKGVEEFLDIGANNLSTINKLMPINKKIKLFHAIDIIEKKSIFKDESRGRYYKVAQNVNIKDFPLEPNTIDFINIRFVLHHFNSLEDITHQLQICFNLLKDGGRLLLWEESFEDEFNAEIFRKNRAEGLLTDLELTKRLYDLSVAERIEFIQVNDWIINTKNPHMPWTGQYYSWRKWMALFSDAGFKLKGYKNLGLRVNGKLKQGVNIIGEFVK